METKDQLTAQDMERIYQNAMMLLEGQLYLEAADEFARIPGYRDADAQKEACLNKAETARLDKIYAEADKAANNDNVKSQEKAIRLFEMIRGYRDADERILNAYRRIEEIRTHEAEDRQEAIRKAEEEKIIKQRRRKRFLKGLVIATACLIVCALGAVLVKTIVVPAVAYRKAVKMIETDPDGAYLALHEMNFANSHERVTELAKDRLKGAEIGSTVSFGCYPQGRNTSKEKSLIEWVVIDKDGSKLLLISKYALDCLPFQRYDERLASASWETSLLREWLNNTFLNEAFDKGEAKLLVRTNPDTDVNAFRSFPGGMDRVFLLNIPEAEKYFPDDESRKCLPTRYAIDFGAYQSSIGRTCYWWLRTTVLFTEEALNGTPGETAVRAACVGTSGRIVEVGHSMFNRNYCVRPVIWVDTEGSGELAFGK